MSGLKSKNAPLVEEAVHGIVDVVVGSLLTSAHTRVPATAKSPRSSLMIDVAESRMACSGFGNHWVGGRKSREVVLAPQLETIVGQMTLLVLSKVVLALIVKSRSIISAVIAITIVHITVRDLFHVNRSCSKCDRCQRKFSSVCSCQTEPSSSKSHDIMHDAVSRS